MAIKYKIDRIYRDESDLIFKIRFPKSKSFSDIADIKFLLKETKDQPLDEAVVSKTLIGTEIESVSPNLAKVKWTTTDYDSMNIGDIYYAGLFCKWTGDNDFDENVESLYEFEIVQNFDNNV